MELTLDAHFLTLLAGSIWFFPPFLRILYQPLVCHRFANNWKTIRGRYWLRYRGNMTGGTRRSSTFHRSLFSLRLLDLHFWLGVCNQRSRSLCQEKQKRKVGSRQMNTLGCLPKDCWTDFRYYPRVSRWEPSKNIWVLRDRSFVHFFKELCWQRWIRPRRWLLC